MCQIARDGVFANHGYAVFCIGRGSRRSVWHADGVCGRLLDVCDVRWIIGSDGVGDELIIAENSQLFDDDEIELRISRDIFNFRRFVDGERIASDGLKWKECSGIMVEGCSRL